MTEMVLQDQFQNKIPLKSIHKEMEDCHHSLYNSGSKNIALCRMGFNCQVVMVGGQRVTKYFSFDLRFPSNGNSPVTIHPTHPNHFSPDGIVLVPEALEHASAYGGRQQLFNRIQAFNTLGRGICNPGNVKHGNQPNYNNIGNVKNVDLSYIRHSEQMLVASLALPQSAQLLKNQISTLIRGEFSQALNATILGIGIHLNQNKTCCGACEYSLVGLMNNTHQGLIPNLRNACINQQETLGLQIAPANTFRFISTVAAKENDATHNTNTTFNRQSSSVSSPLQTIIDMTQQTSSQKVYTTIFYTHDQRNAPPSPPSFDGSTIISGSKVSKGTAGTIQASLALKNDSLDFSTLGIARLFA